MNRYTVVYLTEADENLIAIWADATDRHRVTESANAADRLLATSPRNGSIEICEGLQRLDIPPLRFYFTIREDDRLVEISNVVRVAK